MSKEIFHSSIVITVAFSAHALTNAFLFQHCYILFVPVVPTLIGMQNEVRMAYVLKQEDLARAMDILAVAIKKYNETH